MVGKRKDYDDDALVLDIARGEKTYVQIGRELGLNPVTVRRIARGRARPELQPRIQAAIQSFVDQARRLAARLAVPAVAHLGSLIGPDSTAPPEVQRKAALDIIRYALGDPPGARTGGASPQSHHQPLGFLIGLPPDKKAAVLSVLGGPEVEDPDPAAPDGSKA